MIKKNLKKILIIMLIIIISSSIGASAVYILNSTAVTYAKTGGGTSTVKEALDELYAKTPKFTKGQLVTYKSEQFYVLYEGVKTVELFAKTNLNSAATAQANGGFTSTGCAFSSTNYWSSLWKKGTILNLNNVTGYNSTDVMGKVKTYARTKEAINGRLLTYEEANTLISGNVDMMAGKGNTAQGYERYWLAAAYEDSNSLNVWGVYGGVDGSGGSSASIMYSGSNYYGVRPVIEVYKSQVT